MQRIVKLAVLVALIYLGFTYGRPWIESLIDRRGGLATGGSDDVGRCIRMAWRATDTFGEQLARLKVPIDQERWAGGLAIAEGHTNRARTSCVCDERPCERANDALSRLAALMESTDRSIRSGDSFFNPATELEAIQNMLSQARGDDF